MEPSAIQCTIHANFVKVKIQFKFKLREILTKQTNKQKTNIKVPLLAFVSSVSFYQSQD